MAQSLSKLYVHLIFSTKGRERTLPDEIRPDLHAYLAGTLKGLGCAPIEINSEPDHAHILFVLVRTAALSDIVGQLKKSSNDWLRKQGPQFASPLTGSDPLALCRSDPPAEQRVSVVADL